ncbi:MAG: hypothetical protein F6J92_21385 [Symploca sp. SIO1A3]|nr:hypothetical protein [Symploca sp. SIO1A3]
MSIRDERLSNDYRALQKLCAFNEPVKIQMVEGSRPPEYYRLHISNCKSVESVSNGMPKYRTNHILEISSFPIDYPDPGKLPSVKLITPIFHPNVYSSDGSFCFQGSELKSMSHPLDALVKRVIGMLQYENLRFGFPANREAENWANQNKHLFPFSSNSSISQSSRQLNWR